VAVDPNNGNVYVVDGGDDKVEQFGSGGNYLSQFGTGGIGNGQLDVPSGVAVDSAGAVDVVDRGNNRVEQFDALGNYVSQFTTGATPDQHPFGVAIDPSTQDLYVTDDGHDEVEKFAKD
jgi:DNA-binding beta-propeller fold protein YncE